MLALFIMFIVNFRLASYLILNSFQLASSSLTTNRIVLPQEFFCAERNKLYGYVSDYHGGERKTSKVHRKNFVGRLLISPWHPALNNESENQPFIVCRRFFGRRAFLVILYLHLPLHYLNTRRKVT